jgi:sugar lactone lactonase YvrE
MELLTDLKEYNFEGPDGMVVNNDGFVFVALYGKGNVVLVINPEGNVIGYLPTGPLTSNCVFAADDKTLYITANKKLMRVVVPEMIK